MGLFSFLKGTDINQGIQQYKAAEGAFLLDVRTGEEYAAGHIPGSINLPLHRIQNIESVIPDKTAPLFVYCQSGARSRQAVSCLTASGYTKVTDIGAFSNYQGKEER